MREGFGPPNFIYKYSNKEKVMQPGPFNAKNQKFYNDIADIVSKINVDIEQTKIDDSELKLKKKYQRDIDGMLDWWRPKAINRYTKLLDNNNLKTDILFYNKLCGLTWNEAKERFLDEVGR